MRFDPKSEAEVNTGGALWPRGEYDFEVVAAEETVSKSGNEMIALELDIYDSAGKSKRILDYLIALPETQYKVRHFATAVGLLTQYETGELGAEMLEGRTGRCKINIKKGTDGFADNNAVADYVKPVETEHVADESVQTGAKKNLAKQDLNDDIPFAPS